MDKKVILNPRVDKLQVQGDIRTFREEFGLSRVHLAGILMCTPTKVATFEREDRIDRELVLSLKQFKYLSDFIDRYEQEHETN